jgi:hypothetical protein
MTPAAETCFQQALVARQIACQVIRTAGGDESGHLARAKTAAALITYPDLHLVHRGADDDGLRAAKTLLTALERESR